MPVRASVTVQIRAYSGRSGTETPTRGNSPFCVHGICTMLIPAKGYTYPHSTAYYHYKGHMPQSQDFVTVFVIIDKSGALKLCILTMKSPQTNSTVYNSGLILRAILEYVSECISSGAEIPAEYWRR